MPIVSSSNYGDVHKNVDVDMDMVIVMDSDENADDQIQSLQREIKHLKHEQILLHDQLKKTNAYGLAKQLQEQIALNEMLRTETAAAPHVPHVSSPSPPDSTCLQVEPPDGMSWNDVLYERKVMLRQVGQLTEDVKSKKDQVATLQASNIQLCADVQNLKAQITRYETKEHQQEQEQPSESSLKEVCSRSKEVSCSSKEISSLIIQENSPSQSQLKEIRRLKATNAGNM